MKVKSLLLSMCAIAALASCSQNDDEITGGSNAPEAKVTIRFAGSGSGVATRVGDETEKDGAITSLTAYFFNSSGALIKTPINVLTVAGGVTTETNGDKTANLTTTTDATQVILVANAPNADMYTDVTTTDQLKNKVISSLGAETLQNYPIEQKKDHLTMSGWGAININGESRTASVTLHFTAAKISKINFSFTDTDSKKKYATNGESDLKQPNPTKWFYIKQAYLMMAQTNSTLMPADASTTGWTGTFGPTTGLAYAGAFKWNQTTDPVNPWQSQDASKTTAVNSTDYLNNVITVTEPFTTGIVGNVLGDKQFYVFENNTSVATDATAVVVEARCNIKKGESMAQESRYFTVYFGEKTDKGDNFANIKGGQSYEISLTANGSFDPAKGTGGGGTPDPTKPTVPADVTVTVHPAKWVTNTDINKQFN